MIIERLSDIRPESGKCWICAIPAALRAAGDAVDDPAASSLILFEDGREIGPAHSSHSAIREAGGGAYSHWGDSLYFSSSDGSDPRRNGRRYELLGPTEPGEWLARESTAAARAGVRPDLLQRALEAGFAENGSELYTLSCLRMLAHFLGAHRRTITGSSFLEIGCSPTLGLPVALLLLGARSVTANNVLPLLACVREDYLRNLGLLLAPLGAAPWTSLAGERSARGIAIPPPRLAVFGGVGAAELPASIRDIDVIYSFSVLEHVRGLPDALARTRLMLSENGLCIHFFDLRDHTSFADPLRFLRASEAEFAKAYSAEHNRWRPAEYAAMFREAGYRILDIRHAGAFPLNASGRTDGLYAVENPVDRIFVESLDAIPLSVSEADRKRLQSPYNALSLAELSVAAMCIVAERAT